MVMMAWGMLLGDHTAAARGGAQAALQHRLPWQQQPPSPRAGPGERAHGRRRRRHTHGLRREQRHRRAAGDWAPPPPVTVLLPVGVAAAVGAGMVGRGASSSSSSVVAPSTPTALSVAASLQWHERPWHVPPGQRRRRRCQRWGLLASGVSRVQV
jgi:hypothetical protein